MRTISVACTHYQRRLCALQVLVFFLLIFFENRYMTVWLCNPPLFGVEEEAFWQKLILPEEEASLRQRLGRRLSLVQEFAKRDPARALP